MDDSALTCEVPSLEELLDLKQKAEQLRFAQDTVGIVTWVWDLVTDRVTWYGDLSPLLGMAPESFAGRFRDYLALVHPDDADSSRQAFVDCLKGRRPHYRSEERLVAPDGSVRWIETHCRAFYGFKGGAVKMTGMLTDVTYRKMQEEALALSEEKFFRAFHATPDAIALTRLADGMLVEMNAAFSHITGYPASEALGRTTTALGIWSGEAQRAKVAQKLAAKGKVRNMMGTLVRRDGARRTVIFNAERLMIGDVPHLMSVTRDITEQHTAEKALAGSERRYRSLFDAAPDSIAILSPEGGILDANPAACRAAGLPREALIGRPITEFMAADDLAGQPLRLGEVLERGSLVTEREVRRGDGSMVPVEVRAWPLPDGNIQLILRDLTERRRSEALVRELNITLERRVAERTAELEAANRELESFSQTISHDLRAPVRAIAGFTAELRRSNAGHLDAPGTRYLDLVERSAHRMDTMIADLLKFARAGRTPVNRQSVDMRALAASVVEELAGPDVRAEISLGELPAVLGDPSLLRQVWINLLSNAIKFVSKANRPRIVIDSAMREGAIEFAVSDNGCGFDPEYSDKLFGMFQRLHTEREYEGTGVGLAIVQRIVERHGGRVSAHSGPGAGAEFRFTLPVWPGGTDRRSDPR